MDPSCFNNRRTVLSSDLDSAPKFNLNLVCVTETSQSEGHRETERHAGYGKSHVIKNLHTYTLDTDRRYLS